MCVLRTLSTFEESIGPRPGHGPRGSTSDDGSGDDSGRIAGLPLASGMKDPVPAPLTRIFDVCFDFRCVWSGSWRT